MQSQDEEQLDVGELTRAPRGVAAAHVHLHANVLGTSIGSSEKDNGDQLDIKLCNLESRTKQM